MIAPLQLEALYSLLDDDGSGTLTVHEMIDLFVRPARLPALGLAPPFRRRRDMWPAAPDLFLRPHRTVSTTTPSSSTTATATPRPTTGEHIRRSKRRHRAQPIGSSCAFVLMLRADARAGSATATVTMAPTSRMADSTVRWTHPLDFLPSPLLSHLRLLPLGSRARALSDSQPIRARSQLQHLPLRRQRLRR